MPINSSPGHTAQPASPVAGAMAFPEPAALERVSSTQTIDQAIAELHAHKDRWAQLDTDSKLALLDELHHDLRQQGPHWVGLTLEAKRVSAGGFAEGEEWATYGGVLRLLRLLSQSLHDMHNHGRPKLPGKPALLDNGQISVPTFPTSLLERMLLPGMRAETWLEPGVSRDNLFIEAGNHYHSPNAGRVALVLGAGNMGAIQCADLLHKLFVERQVVVLKTNPINAYLGPILERGFQALIRRGFLRIVYGGADVGAYLCEHPQIDTLHLTGSDKTFDTIVFGPGQEGQQRKKERKPRLAKPMTAELGGVNPIIVVPGFWSANDIKRAALMIATWLYSNAGFGCLAPRLLILHRQWPQRQVFLDALGQVLGETPLRPAYYPGAHARQAAFVAAHPTAQLYGTPAASHSARDTTLQWTLIPDVDSSNVNDICFQTEAFCALLSETALDARDAADFLEKATEFSNSSVWGTLAASVLIADNVKADKHVGWALQRAVADLRFGTICINQYTGFVYSLMNIPWGGYPGQEIWNIQSGTGFVNNPFMLRQPQKSIFYAPFTRIDPVTLRHRSVAAFCKQYADFQSQPSPSKLLKLFAIAMKG